MGQTPGARNGRPVTGGAVVPRWRARGSPASASTRARSELRTKPELEAPVVSRPTRVEVHRPRTRGRQRIAEHFLLVHGGGVQQVAAGERELQVSSQGIAYRAVKKSRCLLEHGQPDAAVEVVRQVAR